MEKNEMFQELRNSINLLKDEAIKYPDKVSENVRWMREGIAEYLENSSVNFPELIQLSMDFRFRTGNVSIESVKKVIVQELPGALGWGKLHQRTITSKIENAPASGNLWMENVGVILNFLR